MPELPLRELTSILQTSISPVILVSGVGLLVLSMTNRFARTTDRVRQLTREIRKSPNGEGEVLRRQMHILYRRSHVLRRAIYYASVCIFLVSLLIAALFTVHFLRLGYQMVVAVLFLLSVLSLSVSMAYFMVDVRLSMEALEEEARPFL